MLLLKRQNFEKGKGCGDLQDSAAGGWSYAGCNLQFGVRKHVVSGLDKSEILEKVLNTPYQPDKYPAQLIHSQDGTLYWFADKEAAPLIENVLS